jgi:hypothetical protein
LFFHTGSPFISVDIIEETQHPFTDYSDSDPIRVCVEDGGKDMYRYFIIKNRDCTVVYFGKENTLCA